MKIEYLQIRNFLNNKSILFLFLLLCTGSTQLGLSADSDLLLVQNTKVNPEKNESVYSDALNQKDNIEVITQNNKTKIIFGLAQEIKVRPEYEDYVLELHFSEPVQPMTVSGIDDHFLIKDMSFAPKEDAARVLSVELSEKVQFLVSRTRPDLIQIILVPAQQKDPKSRDSKEQNSKNATLTDVEFTEDKEDWIYIKLAASQNDFSYKTLPGKQDQIVISFPGLEIPLKYQKLYNLQKFESQVKSALLQDSEQGGRLLLKVQKRFPLHIDKQAENFVLSFKRQKKTGDRDDGSFENMKSTDNKVDEPTVKLDMEQESSRDLQELNTLFPGMKEEYTGRPISIDVQDAEVEHILRLLAEISGDNLIIDQDVGGRISLKLKEVPWDQALDLVLMQNDLGMVKKGNILRIASRNKLKNEQQQIRDARKAALESKKSMEDLEPLNTEYIQVNYSKAEQLEAQVSNFLSERGRISNDSRTNQLIVSDTQSRIDQIRGVVRKLDRPERQVLIEARVVYANDSFARSLGISWNFAGSKEYNIFGTEVSSSVDGFVLNPPSGPGTMGLTATGGQIATTAIDFFNLDAQLKLGETKNVSKTVSSPRIVTLNNEAATISQGVKIATPGESESGGTTTEYVDATLNLSVTPQITPNDKLILDLNISDDSPAGENDIDTRSATTRLIVDDEETIVLGGVHQVQEADMENRVPGLKDIPLFSWLFKNQYIDHSKRELLIFIRTKILE